MLISCEHGGNRIPPELRPVFRGHDALLATHRGYDTGALSLAKSLARSFKVPLVAARTSRLVIDLNRSVGHPALFSPLTRALPMALRDDILAHHYRPHRARLWRLIDRQAALAPPVLHIAAHSFTPELDGHVRTADIGLLYDPRRPAERAFCRDWQAELKAALPGLRVRRNYPYRGAGDGVTAALRRRHPDARYLGIEIELNQAIVQGDPRILTRVRRALAATLRRTLTKSASYRTDRTAPLTQDR